MPGSMGGGGGGGGSSTIVFGLIVVQVIYGAYSVLLGRVLSLGLDPLFLVACGGLTTSAFLAPFAVAFERKKWQGKFSPRLMVQIVFIAMGGVTTFQALMLMGIEKTSPAIASAMPNLAPGVIFIIAACLRFERVDITCAYSRAKILGTLMCLGGAIAMSFLQSPTGKPTPKSHASFFPREPSQGRGDGDWIVGCIYLLSAVFIASCTVVLQAAAMIEFPAPLSLSAITSLIGAMLTAAVQLIAEGKFSAGSPVIGISTTVFLILLGGSMTGICVGFQTWSVGKRGPVLVSMFNPIGTVSSAVVSALTLGQVMNVGSLVGMLVLFVGLYLVLWAKKKEGFALPDGNGPPPPRVGDSERPLLS